MTIMKTLLRAAISITAAALLLTACAQKEATFPVIYTQSLEDGEAAFSQLANDGKLAAYKADGSIEYGTAAELKDLKELTGVIADAPEYSTKSVCTLAEKMLADDEDVMILYLDGFGWTSWLEAVKEGLVPELSKLETHMAASVFPSITPVNYAAMVTGCDPKENGVDERGDHQLTCESLFDYAKTLGKNIRIIEGDKQIIEFSAEQDLNPDMDEDGDTDTEVLENALDAMKEGAELLFVHFHGIDDTEHKNGPYTKEAYDKIAQTDKWAAQLMDTWQGRVIVIADHGQHVEQDKTDGRGGTHGQFRYEDMLVPLLIR